MNDEQETAALVKSFLATSDQEAAAVLVRRYQTLVSQTVSRHVPMGEVEEICQEVFLDFFRALPNLRDYSTTTYFLRRIAMRRICDFWRNRRRTGEVSQAEVAYSPELISDPRISSEDRACLRELLEKAMSELSTRGQAIVRLSFIEGESLREVARILGISVVAAKVEAFRVRLKLRSLIGKLIDHEGGVNEQ